MTCILTRGRSEPCKDKIAGIQAVYFINSATIVEDSDGLITDINNGSSSSVIMYKYTTKESSQFQEKVLSSDERGTTFWEQLLSLIIKHVDTDSRTELIQMAYSRPLVVVMDNNGSLFLIGKESGVSTIEGTMDTGIQYGDFYGYRLNLRGREPKPANFVTPGTDSYDSSYPFENLTTPPIIIKGSDIDELRAYILRVDADSGTFDTKSKNCVSAMLIKLTL